MTKRIPMGTLVASGEAAPATRPTRDDLLSHVARAFDMNPNLNYRSVHGIEGGSIEVLRARRYNGTLLEHVADAIRTAGVDVGQTLGDVMDVLEVDRHELHEIACACHHTHVSGAGIAIELRRLRGTPEPAD